MTQMLREMRRSMLDDDEDEGKRLRRRGDDRHRRRGTWRGVEPHGGIGLTDSLLKAFERQITGIQDTSARGEGSGSRRASRVRDQTRRHRSRLISDRRHDLRAGEQQVWMAAGPADRAKQHFITASTSPSRTARTSKRRPTASCRSPASRTVTATRW